MKPYPTTSAKTVMIETVKPPEHRSRTFTEAVLIPVAISGVIGSVGILLASEAAPGYWKAIGGASFVLSFVAQVVLDRVLLHSVEKVFETDLDNDGYVGKPEPLKTIKTRVEVTVDKGGRKSVRIPEFAETSEMVEHIMRCACREHAANTAPDGSIINRKIGILAYKNWVGGKNPMTRDRLKAFKTVLLRVGFITSGNPTRFTDEGLAWAREFDNE